VAVVLVCARSGENSREEGSDEDLEYVLGRRAPTPLPRRDPRHPQQYLYIALQGERRRSISEIADPQQQQLVLWGSYSSS